MNGVYVGYARVSRAEQHLALLPVFDPKKVTYYSE
jgi:hypothetical protein